MSCEPGCLTVESTEVCVHRPFGEEAGGDSVSPKKSLSGARGAIS